eukprot:TRINITY_DN7460_c0_g3_i3.p1 TRINITY_DN7460_c0_g3~~TRINITY_DN7460_c0_g3_i3.p1  ORF type:complete len:378 (-),score=73.93 TRINITY_DN7460_c0_g3_i3:41-1174(-)
MGLVAPKYKRNTSSSSSSSSSASSSSQDSLCLFEELRQSRASYAAWSQARGAAPLPFQVSQTNMATRPRTKEAPSDPYLNPTASSSASSSSSLSIEEPGIESLYGWCMEMSGVWQSAMAALALLLRVFYWTNPPLSFLTLLVLVSLASNTWLIPVVVQGYLLQRMLIHLLANPAHSHSPLIPSPSPAISPSSDPKPTSSSSSTGVVAAKPSGQVLRELRAVLHTVTLTQQSGAGSSAVSETLDLWPRLFQCQRGLARLYRAQAFVHQLLAFQLGSWSYWFFYALLVSTILSLISVWYALTLLRLAFLLCLVAPLCYATAPIQLIFHCVSGVWRYVSRPQSSRRQAQKWGISLAQSREADHLYIESLIRQPGSENVAE